MAALAERNLSSVQPAQELVEIVHLNEGIKAVIEIAFRVNLMALNAILLASKAGDSALGFGIISKELRILSVKLTQLMHDIGHEASLSVHLISDSLRRSHRQRLLKRTEIATNNSLPALIASLRLHGERLESNQNRIAQLRTNLLGELDTSRKLCTFGVAISRTARIEAAYGAAFSKQLAQVSEDFDITIQTILPALEALCSRMKELQ